MMQGVRHASLQTHAHAGRTMGNKLLVSTVNRSVLACRTSRALFASVMVAMREEVWW